VDTSYKYRRFSIAKNVGRTAKRLIMCGTVFYMSGSCYLYLESVLFDHSLRNSFFVSPGKVLKGSASANRSGVANSTD